MVKMTTGQNGDKPKQLQVQIKRINFFSSTMDLLGCAIYRIWLNLTESEHILPDLTNWMGLLGCAIYRIWLNLTESEHILPDLTTHIYISPGHEAKPWRMPFRMQAACVWAPLKTKRSRLTNRVGVISNTVSLTWIYLPVFPDWIQVTLYSLELVWFLSFYIVLVYCFICIVIIHSTIVITL